MIMSAIKKLISLALPMMGTRMVQTLNTFILMVILAQLGHTVLAASFTISIVRIAVMVVFMSPLFALGAIVGRQLGEKNIDQIPNIIKQAWLTALLLSVPVMIIFLLIKPILILFHQPPSIIPYVNDYFKYFLFAFPAIYIVSANQQILACLHKQRLVLLMSFLSLALCAFLNDGLILGHFGLPALGVIGGGITGIISNWLYLIISTYFVYRFIRKPILSQAWQGLRWMKMIFKIGTPIFIKIASEMLMMFVLAIFIGWLGQVSMAAGQISNQYMLCVLVPIIGLGEAGSILISRAVGAKQYDELKQLNHACLISAIAFSLGIAILFLIFHRLLADVFIHFNAPDAKAIYVLAMWLLLIRTLNMFFDGPTMTLVWSLRGLYDTQFPMWISIAVTWLILIPLAWILGFGFHFGIIGITLAGVVGSIISVVILRIRWCYQLQKCSILSKQS